MLQKFSYTDELALAVQLLRADARHKGSMTPVFLHFSDIHNSAEHFDSIMDFYNQNRGLITDVVLTGDIVAGRFCEGLEPSVSEQLGSVLPVVGNHDMLGGTGGWDWSVKVSEAELYGLIFKNRAEGLIIEEGKTYWYKDYESCKLRMLGLNACLGADEAQLAWLKSTLDGALEAGYSVIIAEHYPPSHAKPIKCSYSSVTIAVEELPGGTLSEAVQAVVAEFKKSGGEFICYLNGHTHVDFIFVNENYPDQLFVTVDSAHISQANYWSDTYRVAGTKSQELFNLFSYDTSNKVVKLVRFGANADCLLRSKRSLCVNYLTGEVVSQS